MKSRRKSGRFYGKSIETKGARATGVFFIRPLTLPLRAGAGPKDGDLLQHELFFVSMLQFSGAYCTLGTTRDNLALSPRYNFAPVRIQVFSLKLLTEFISFNPQGVWRLP